MKRETNITPFFGRSYAIALLPMIMLSGCDGTPDARLTRSLNELVLEDARRCEAVYTWPQELIDGLSAQLIDELQCMDSSLLTWYEPCKAVGCIWAEGPQPYALRPEVVAELASVATSLNDYITISAGYRDVAMQYYSRWYRENCVSTFNAAEPGKSNHQGGRAIDVKYYSYWWDSLLEFGFDHPIPSDKPHFELRGSSVFRAESEELKVLSILAFQRLWNRNNPDDLIPEDGVYGPRTKERLGASPVAGFADSGCLDPEPPLGPDDPIANPGEGEEAPVPPSPTCKELIEECANLYPCPLLDGTECFMPNPDPCRGIGCGRLCSEVGDAEGCIPDGEPSTPPAALFPPPHSEQGCSSIGGFRWSSIPWFKVFLLGVYITYRLWPRRSFYESIEEAPPAQATWLDRLTQRLPKWARPGQFVESEDGRDDRPGMHDEPAHWKMPCESDEELDSGNEAPVVPQIPEPASGLTNDFPEDSLEQEFQEALRRVKAREEVGTGPEATDLFLKRESSEQGM